MNPITLPCGLITSAVGVGTASLHHLSAIEADGLLRNALDLGLRHVDTAPLYGAGLCEAWVGHVLRDYPDVTVTTKVGLRARLGETRSRGGMLMRKLAGRAVPLLARPAIVSRIVDARRSLDGSLRRLRRDHVDMLMLHEPDAAMINTDEWPRWLESENSRVRFFGLAGSAERLVPFFERGDRWAVQTSIVPDFALHALEAAGAKVDFTFGHLSGLGANPHDVTTLLRQARQKRPRTAIIVSTRRRERLGNIAGALA